ncbi:MAG TPA: aldo/keto reductase [Caulobacteraceae bacterium]|jgi:D-threo-aldose 1-dehydrogenase|nr:aldo/keto reductase [Caulobacteraceae bacterium]
MQRAVFTTRGGRELPFTSLGFGGAPLGNYPKALGEAEAEATVEAAWAAGMRYFDTAPLYGLGLSEARMGAVLGSRRRGEYLISTKVGRLLDPCPADEADGGIYVNVPALKITYDYSYDGVMRSYEESLKRLGLSRVDILYVHDVDARNQGGVAGSEARIRELINTGGWRALDQLRAAGDVAAIGAGVNEWEPCVKLLDACDPDLFLLAGRYTLLEQEPLNTLFPRCGQRGVGIVNGGPFNSGVLVGGDHYDYAAVPDHIVERVVRLRAVCAEFGVALPDAALQFAGAHPVVATVIAGAQSSHEAAANAESLTRPAPAAFWAALKDRGLVDADAPVPEAAPC